MLVPWSEKPSHFTLLFERWAIDILKVFKESNQCLKAPQALLGRRAPPPRKSGEAGIIPTRRPSSSSPWGGWKNKAGDQVRRYGVKTHQRLLKGTKSLGLTNPKPWTPLADWPIWCLKRKRAQHWEGLGLPRALARILYRWSGRSRPKLLQEMGWGGYSIWIRSSHQRSQ